MKVLLSLIVSMVLFQGCQTPKETAGRVTASQAEKIAKRTFLKSMANHADDYELKKRGEDNTDWLFFFAPRKIVRTGDVILINVNKKTGATRFHPGE